MLADEGDFFRLDRLDRHPYNHHATARAAVDGHKVRQGLPDLEHTPCVALDRMERGAEEKLRIRQCGTGSLRL
jgi:hypothetical protein